MKKVKLFLVFGLLIMVILLGLGCSETGTEDKSTVISNLEAVNANTLRAEFSDGNTEKINQFTPQPLKLGEETEVNFTYKDTSYSETVTYKVDLTGDLSNTQQLKTQSVSSEVAKVVLFYADDYKVVKVKEGKFKLAVDKKKPAGVIFAGSDNSFIGYLTFENGIDSLPVNSISGETGKINLGDIAFNGKAGTPENNPVGKAVEVTTTEKDVIAAADNLFSTIVKNPDFDDNGKVDLLETEEKKMRMDLAYYVRENQFTGTEVTSFADNLGIKSYKMDINIKHPNPPGEATIIRPGDVPNIKDGKTKEQNGWVSYGTGAVTDVVPPADGEYQISSSILNFSFSISSIEAQAKENLVFPVPNVKLNSDGKIDRIDWTVKTGTGEVIESPAKILNAVNIQINCKSDVTDKYEIVHGGDTRIYNSGKIDPKPTQHEVSKEILWSDVAAINMTYDDIYNIHYVVPFGKE